MLGLGEYQSSSEDELDQSPSLPKHDKNEQQPPAPDTTNKAQTVPNEKELTDKSSAPPLSGPFLGPSHEAAPPPNVLPDRGASPFSTSRTLIQDLTLPPIPNLDIPPSPPGSPNPATNAKFAHFLSLKAQNVHFNEKLASSASLRNPSLLQKLMEHSGIDDQAQYATSLPRDVWDVSKLPAWGFKEELLKAQKEFHKIEQKASGQRDTIHFVGAMS
ncbi:hypothetical protein FE257_011912 [Aspergillus nanangensis]|uniref:HCNGP-like family protein n=1 Tax=Aspergillus nanangensis TaxID=2582783 RepID=A0AAD4CGT1_ASPNN|nr:hypothetical protein FE257_011912 [Aspergillus nanangensis]